MATIETTIALTERHFASHQRDTQGDTDALLHGLKGRGRDHAEFALYTPDLYPAKNVADFLGVRVAAVHKWRRVRGIRRATS